MAIAITFYANPSSRTQTRDADAATARTVPHIRLPHGVSRGSRLRPASRLSDREVVIATREAAPFAMKAADGSWTGISIDLWRRIGDQLQLRYRFVEEPTVPGLLEGTAQGR